MADIAELRQGLQRMAGLVRELEEIADPNARSAAKQLVRTLMDLHGAVLERTLDKVFEAGETGQRIIDELGADPLVSGLLVLYGLHPQDLETRVTATFQRIAPNLRSHGAEPELLGIDAGEVRLRVTIGAHSCGSTARTARTLLEDALYEAAPDITSLVIEGLDGKAASGFVALEKLLAHDSSGPVGALL